MYKFNSEINFEPQIPTNEKEGFDLFRKKYEDIIELRENLYKEDIDNHPELSGVNKCLNNHNNIVEEYAYELIEDLKAKDELNHEDAVTAMIATILHDSGKLDSSLLDHHQKSGERSDKILDNFLEKIENDFNGRKIDGVEINHSIILKARRAIQRHMNHPFLVNLHGKEFSHPVNNIDKVVFDADMLANIGFKNVGFRIINPKFSEEDEKVAHEKNINPIQASFDNVMKGIIALAGTDDKKVLTTSEGQEKAVNLVEIIKNIYKSIDFEKLQKEINENSENKQEIINDYIISTGNNLKIDKNLLKKFLI